MTTKLIIFDCDGVLVDSESLSNETLAEMLAGHGYEISSAETKRRFLGSSLTKCLDTLQSETGIPLPESFEPDFRQRMSGVFQSQLQPVDGAHRLIESLRVPFCVASSGPRRKIEENLAITGLLPHFADSIFSAYEVQKWKPDPGLFLAAADHFDVLPRDCLVIEDSAIGVRAALAAEMTVLALNAEPVDAAFADATQVFASMSEIHAHLVASGTAGA